MKEFLYIAAIVGCIFFWTSMHIDSHLDKSLMAVGLVATVILATVIYAKVGDIN